MNTKTLGTVLLLAFVAVSLGYLVVSETMTGADGTAATPARPATAATAPASASAVGDAAPDHRIIAYYFHNTQRCATCLKIERLAEAALREQLPEAFDDGTLTWRAVNMEQPANVHFVEEYGLVTSSVVLVDQHDGKQRDWTLMDKVWEYVHDDEPAFKEYVVAQAREYLEF